MKLVIYYDFINALRNVNEPLNAFKVVRNEKNVYIKKTLPFFLGVDTIVTLGNPERIPIVLSLQYLSLLGVLSLGMYKNKDLKDFYKDRSRNDLINLTSQLKDLNINTDYDLLSKSTLDGKVSKICLNESKMPIIKENKYILVPSYQYDGSIKDVSIEQEHIYGNKEYVLSIGSKQKELKPAYMPI